jgi:hypothetical protein
LNYKVFPYISPVVYVLIFNGICFASILALLFAAAHKDQLPAPETTLLVALPALTGNLVWLVSTGMEHLLYVAMVLAASFSWFSDPREKATTVCAATAGFLCGIAITTRPEGVLLVPLFLLAAIPLKKTRRQVIAFTVPCLCAILIVIGVNWLTAHSFLPVTFSGRRWLYFNLGGTPPARPVLAFLFIQEVITHIRLFVLGLDFNGTGDAAALLVAAVMVSAGVWRLVRRASWRILFLVVLAAAHIVIYAVVMPSTGHAMRYQPMTLVFVFPLIALGALELTQRVADAFKIAPRQGEVSAALLAAVLVFLALRSLLRWGEITDEGIQHINNTHVRMGSWLAVNLPPQTKVAAFDFGAIAYFSRQEIIDIGGLTDPAFIPYLYSHTSSIYMKERGVRWVVIPEDYTEAGHNDHDPCIYVMAVLGLCDKPDMRKRELESFSTERSVWQPGFLATGHAAPRQVLYEIQWY